MTKSTKKTDLQIEIENEIDKPIQTFAEVEMVEAQHPVIVNEHGEDLEDALSFFEQQETALLKNLEVSYLKLSENSTYNFIAEKIEEIEIDGKQVKCVFLHDKNKNKFINGGVVLVQAIEKIQSLPALVRIVTGVVTKAKVGDGKYLKLDVYTL